jgi:hypothetical protein
MKNDAFRTPLGCAAICVVVLLSGPALATPAGAAH